MTYTLNGCKRQVGRWWLTSKSQEKQLKSFKVNLFGVICKFPQILLINKVG